MAARPTKQSYHNLVSIPNVRHLIWSIDDKTQKTVSPGGYPGSGYDYSRSVT